MLGAILLIILSTVCCAALLFIIARRVFPAPECFERPVVCAHAPAATGPLASLIMDQKSGHEGFSGIAPLANGLDAFAARMMLANAAVSSIDAQYYIWRSDMTGYLLLDALQRAADRGVRVRLLLDDNGISGLDPVLSEMDAHENIDVRLFNPFVLRRFKRLSYAFDFVRLNHRMHNKSFTVDGHVSILGGRNIGDAYFGTGTTPLQIDLDVLSIGRVVPDISDDFDRYWNAAPVHSLKDIVGHGKAGGTLARRVENFKIKPEYEAYLALLEASDLVITLERGDMALEWSNAKLVSDDPVDVFKKDLNDNVFTTRLLDAIGPIERRFDGVTPYFVPGRSGVETFVAMKKRGVAVRMLTNSLEATDMLPVHAGYSKRRKAMLRSGIGLFELRAQADTASRDDDFGKLGSSGSNLHAKTFAVDGARVFVGSFNFDPRSALLNTEMGLVIESETMAGMLHSAFDRGLGGIAWQIGLADEKVIWLNNLDQSILDKEPGTSFINRAALRVVGWLPVEWLL